MVIEGHADARFASVRDCFAEVIGGQAGTGAAFAAWCDGRLVVDLWGGSARPGPARSRPGRPGPRTVSRRCSMATWSVSWSAGRTGAAPVSS